jgi:transcriptional regulator with XRE-family HTH domain
MTPSRRPIGEHLREWRTRRRLSQMDLALEAEISTRHLSFLETGRARPSREMVLHLSDQLEIPLRERNVLLMAAGFAPIFPETSLSDPRLEPARRAVDMILKAHEPYPALVVDLRWNLVAANAATAVMMEGVSPDLLSGVINVVRLSLHPDGLAPRIVNLGEWRQHALDRLKRQVDLTADAVLAELLDEVKGYPTPPAPDRRPEDYGEVVIPFQLMTGDTVLSLIGTTTVFGTPVDITLSELTLEMFFPADAATAEALRAAHEARGGA